MGEELGLLEGKLLEEELELGELLCSGQQWLSGIFLKVFRYTFLFYPAKNLERSSPCGCVGFRCRRY